MWQTNLYLYPVNYKTEMVFITFIVWNKFKLLFKIGHLLSKKLMLQLLNSIRQMYFINMYNKRIPLVKLQSID